MIIYPSCDQFEEAHTLIVDNVPGGVQAEEEDGSEAEDDRSLAQEEVCVWPLVLVRAGRLGEAQQQVEQEHRGHARQVQKQHRGLCEKMFVGVIYILYIF